MSIHSQDSPAFRGVNRYVDYITGDEYIEYTKVYANRGPATAQATRTRLKNPYNKQLGVKSIRNTNAVGYPQSVSHYEFAETWTEEAVEWKRL